MEKLEKLLNQNNADLNILYVKLHQFHWLVEGKGFFTLHKQFEKTYEFIHDLYDEIAERIVTLEGTCYTTTRQYQKIAKIVEFEEPITKDNLLVNELLKDLNYIVKSLKETVKHADEIGDVVTSDMLTSALAELEVQIWQYRAYTK